MNISITLLGQIAAVSAVVGGLLSFYLGRRKSETPVLVGIIGSALSLFFPLGLVYVAVLALKPDRPSNNPTLEVTGENAGTST
ncbi:MAG: hypothetical protein DHS20C11_06290 [Lysobacteraceae bacterium]|nr:MAG: hypothetical protein DHS20C11_06290 [Xanthomonadaceae bacterium]